MLTPFIKLIARAAGEAARGRPQCKGFTLIELLVVIAIIAIIIL
jgi:prepilin-type N-terminal cleavage/methylation domain-containing protein